MTPRREGMLWYDGDPRKTALDKLAAALVHYAKSYGRATWAEVHPEALSEEVARDAGANLGIQIRRSIMTLPNHFWIGGER
jgi:hypothetical protein